jgi:hypothetical protein
VAIIGTAHVHIRADDKYFESDVRKATAKIKNVTIQLKADVDLTKATKKIRDLRYRITSKDAVLKVDANVAKAEEKMSKLLAKFLNKDVNFNAKANTSEANNALNELSARYAAKRVPFTAQADTRAANSALAALARTRTANIRATVDPMTQKALSGLFNTITGTISAEKIKGVISGLAANFEGLAFKATAATTAILAVGGALLTTSANALSIAGDITQVIGLTALIPTAIGSMAAIITAAKMSFKGFGDAFDKDAKKAAEALAKLPPQAQKAVVALRGVYTQIQKPVQNAFWEVMDTSLQDMVKALLPSLITGLSNVGRGFATVTREISGGFERMGDGTLENMLNLLGEGLKNMAPGFGALIDSFAILGETGATYLPRFGEWTTELANRFKNFITEAEQTGKINVWIENGVKRLQEMASIVKSTTGFFSGLTTAARLAGAPGLTEMAESMRNIRDIVNGEPFQSRLVTVLEGARAGVDKLKDGFGNLMEFVGESSVALGIFLDKAGEIAGLTFDNIRILFDGTGLGSGLHAAMQGLRDLMENVKPGVEDLGAAMGILGHIAGEVIRNLGPGLNQLFETIRGILERVQEGVIKVIPIFNDFIQQVLAVVQGPLFALSELIGNILEGFANLPGSIQTVIMSIGLFALVFSKLSSAWRGFTGNMQKHMKDADSSIGKNLRNIQNGAQTMGGAFTKVSDEAAKNGARSFQGFGGNVAYTMSQTSEGMRKNMSSAFNAMPSGAQKAVTGIKNAFSNFGAGFSSGLNFNREFDTVREGFSRVPANARNAVDGVKQAFSKFGDFVAPAGSAVRTLASEMHNNLAPARVAFDNMATHARTATVNAATGITSGLKSAMGGLSGFLGGPWGIAIMAATVLFGEMATQQAKAKQQVDNLAAAFEQSGGRIDAGVRKVIAANLDMKASFFGIEFDSGKDIAEKIGVPLKDVQDAAEGVPGAMEKVQKALGQTGNAATTSGSMLSAFYTGMANTTGPAKALFGLAEKMGIGLTEGDKLNKVIGEQKLVMEAAKKKNEDLAASLGIGTVASARLTENYDTLRDATSSVSSRVEALKDNLDILNGSMQTGRKANRDHAETMFEMTDAMGKLHGAVEGTIDGAGRMNDAFRGTLLNVDGTFSNANRGAIDFSKEMDTVATSIMTLGMEEMKKLQDMGKSLPEAQAGAMAVMNKSTEELRIKLGTLGFDAGQVNSIIGQLGLDPSKLEGALVVNTKDAEGAMMRFELFKSAVLSKNWSVALEASTDDVKNAILTTEGYKQAYESGGWEAVVKLQDETGKGFDNLMAKITVAKAEGKDINAILRAEFPGAKVFDAAKKQAEEYDMVDVRAALGVVDNASVPTDLAKKSLQEFNTTPTLDKYLRSVDQTQPGLDVATKNMATLPDVRRVFTAVDQTEEGKLKSQATMNTLKDVIRKLEADNKTGTPTAEAQATLDSLKNVVRDLSANNMAGEGKNAAQRTVDGFKGKETELTALDKATAVVTDVNNAKLANKSFSISAAWEGVSDRVRSFFGFSHGGIMNGAGMQTFANGGVQMPNVKQYANGGTENHVAQIARGAWPVRVWAEPETGGEAYIPLSPSKRKRSLDILEEVAGIFGYNLYKNFADGGVMKESKTPTMITNSTVTQQTITNSGSNANAPTIISNVYPSAGLNEKQIADSVSENIYWKLSTQV